MRASLPGRDGRPAKVGLLAVVGTALRARAHRRSARTGAGEPGLTAHPMAGECVLTRCNRPPTANVRPCCQTEFTEIRVTVGWPRRSSAGPGRRGSDHHGSGGGRPAEDPSCAAVSRCQGGRRLPQGGVRLHRCRGPRGRGRQRAACRTGLRQRDGDARQRADGVGVRPRREVPEGLGAWRPRVIRRRCGPGRRPAASPWPARDRGARRRARPAPARCAGGPRRGPPGAGGAPSPGRPRRGG
jgi:hypothetical protein